MSKRHANPRTIKEAEKVLGYHCAEVQEMALDVGKQIMRDQAEWLDAQMKDLLPPDLYEKGKREECVEEIAAYANKHGIQIILVPDSLAVRIMLHGKPHSQFVPQLLVDGEPVTRTPEKPIDRTRN